MEEQVRNMLLALGEDPDREGLVRTPHRVSEAMKFLTQGYRQDPEEIVRGAMFQEESDEMVCIKNIEIYSLCEHHLLPFIGKAHVAYLPKGKVVGFSKLPRLVDVFARRLQLQERLTSQIAHSMMELLEPHGVGVVIECMHLCMTMRGVQKQNSTATTSALLGSFRTDKRTRAEFLNLIQGNSAM